MAKTMTKSAIIGHLAQKTDLSKKQVVDAHGPAAVARHQGSQERLRAAGLRPARARQPQGPDGPQPADRRAHQDPGQARGEVPARQVPSRTRCLARSNDARRARIPTAPARPGTQARRAASDSWARGSRPRPAFSPAGARGTGSGSPEPSCSERAGATAMLRRSRPVVGPRPDTPPGDAARRGGRARRRSPRTAAAEASTASSRSTARASHRLDRAAARLRRGFIPAPEAELPRERSGGRPGPGSAGAAAPALWSTAGRGGSRVRAARASTAATPVAAAMKLVALAGGTGAAKLLRGLGRSCRPARSHHHREHRRRRRDLGPARLPGSRHRLLRAGRRRSTSRRAGASPARRSTPSTRSPRFGEPVWFNLGDRDLATHLHRTRLLRRRPHADRGHARDRRGPRRAGAACCRCPTSPCARASSARTAGSTFQEYFVREKAQVEVARGGLRRSRRGGAGAGRAGGHRAARTPCSCARRIPITSVGPILAVPGSWRRWAHARPASSPVSPIVGGAAVSGPAGRLMAARGLAGLGRPASPAPTRPGSTRSSSTSRTARRPTRSEAAGVGPRAAPRS